MRDEKGASGKGWWGGGLADLSGSGEGGRLFEGLLGGVEGVLEEHGDGHGTDAAGDGGDGAGDFGAGVVVGITDEAIATFGIGVIFAVDADIDDDSAWFEHIAGDHFGAADGGDDDIGFFEVGVEVAGPAVADGDGGVGFLEEHGDGKANDIGAADDDGIGATDFDTTSFEEDHTAVGGTGDKAWFAPFHGEAADVEGVEAVDIFADVDGVKDSFFVDMVGEGELDEDAVDGGVGVEFLDEGEEVVLADIFGAFVGDGADTGFGAGAFFHTDVGGRGGIIADKDSGEARGIVMFFFHGSHG